MAHTVHCVQAGALTFRADFCSANLASARHVIKNVRVPFPYGCADQLRAAQSEGLVT